MINQFSDSPLIICSIILRSLFSFRTDTIFCDRFIIILTLCHGEFIIHRIFLNIRIIFRLRHIIYMPISKINNLAYIPILIYPLICRIPINTIKEHIAIFIIMVFNNIPIIISYLTEIIIRICSMKNFFFANGHFYQIFRIIIVEIIFKTVLNNFLRQSSLY